MNSGRFWSVMLRTLHGDAGRTSNGKLSGLALPVVASCGAVRAAGDGCGALVSCPGGTVIYYLKLFTSPLASTKYDSNNVMLMFQPFVIEFDVFLNMSTRRTIVQIYNTEKGR